MALQNSRLGLFESTVALQLAARGPGTYTQQFLVEGNSIISSLFIETADPGATVKVNWYDTTVGSDVGERFDLGSHPLYTGPIGPITDRQVIARVHNKPVVEIIVTGGNVTFGIYVTIVSAFATAGDAALVSDNQTVQLGADKGTPQAIYDPVAGKWYFAQGTGGVQSVKVLGAVSTTPVVTSAVLSGTDSPDFGDSVDLISYTAVGSIMVGKILVGGDSDGEFSVYIRGTLWGKIRNSWGQRQVPLDLGIVELSPGDTFRIAVENTAQSGTMATYEAFAYYGS